jgi:1-deoxy-D-xylulose-5-phosphate reductoisomerase
MDPLNIALLGSTGSIGRQTLDIVRTMPHYFKVVALAAGVNTKLLTDQIAEFKPDYYYHDAKVSLPDKPADCSYLPLEEMAALPQADRIVLAVSGMAGLKPLLASLRAGKIVCLANKESIVTAGAIVNHLAEVNNARILPVDSEHSAIWQCLHAESEQVSRIILTASGGPFRQCSATELAAVTPQQALAHPSWSMGPKVTIDSATMLNKGLEVIEAHWLFGMPFENIKVIVHPQSIVHSIVEFLDGSFKAQLSVPDMRFPIQYALSFPGRLPNRELPQLDWEELNNLHFEKVRHDLFPALRLAVNAGIKGKTYPAVLCAADEVAISLFLAGKIGFTDIVGLIEGALANHSPSSEPDEAAIMTAEAWAREETLSLAGKKG